MAVCVAAVLLSGPPPLVRPVSLWVARRLYLLTPRGRAADARRRLGAAR